MATPPSRSTARVACPGTAWWWPGSPPARPHSRPGLRRWPASSWTAARGNACACAWPLGCASYLRAELAPLHRIAAAAAGDGGDVGDGGDGGGAKLSGPARGLLYQLTESLGLMPRRAGAAQIRGLRKTDRKALGALGLRLGRESVFLPELLDPGPARLGALLGAVHRQRPLPELPAPGALCFEPGPELDDTLCRALGYRRLEHGSCDRLARGRPGAPGPRGLPPIRAGLVCADGASLSVRPVAARRNWRPRWRRSATACGATTPA